MSVGLKGLFTPPAPETRNIAYLDVVHNGQNYDWLIYVPQEVNIGEYLAANEAAVYAQIDAKEAAWEALTPKSWEEIDPMTGENVTVTLQKVDFVQPDSPDYYAKRRAEYPPIGDQLGAIAKGLDSPEYASILAAIEAVKIKYPKP
jgi:hypothetical protein